MRKKLIYNITIFEFAQH